MIIKSKKVNWPGMTPEDRCGCEICRGLAALPPEEFKPKRYWHEVEVKQTPTPIEPTPVPKSQPKPRPVKPVPVPNTQTLDERIAAIQARTDIGQGLKSMQIKNLMLKAAR